MFDAADLSAFFDPDMPGFVSATLSGQTVGGLFRERYAEAFGLVGGGDPVLRVPAATAPSEGDAVQIGARAFTVRTVKLAEPGVLALELESQ